MRKKLIVRVIILSILAVFVVAALMVFIFTPKITLKGKKEMTIELAKDYKEPGYKARYLGKDITSSVKVTGKVNNSKLGTYKIKYTVKKNGLTGTSSREITVIDDIKPEIVLVSGNEVKVCPNTEYKELGFSANDNYDGDLTAKVKVTKKDSQITYEVNDSSKNKVQVIRTISTIDDEKPVITLTGNSTIYLIKGNIYKESGFSATDNCSGDLTNKVQVTNNINVNTTGTYQVNYIVTDDNGNSSTTIRTVKVVLQPDHSGSTIYLTFDDGPSSITPKVLDILKEEGIKATFFVLNKSDAYNYLLKRMVDEGHSIGLHGNSHNYYSVYVSVDTYYNDITTIGAKVKNVTGIDSKIIRFIGGSSNTVSRFSPGIMTTLTAKVLEWGYHYYDWNVSSGDGGGNPTQQVLYNNVVNNLGSKATYIVLMHDYEGNNTTVNALRDIIRYGKNAGYNFDRITWDTPQIHHKINN